MTDIKAEAELIAASGRSKDDLLGDLDSIEKQIGALLSDACGGEVNEPLSIRQSRIRYAEGGLWLRHWIESSHASH